MDQESERLMRAALHDLANVLAGVQGVVDLIPEGAPLTPRNKARLDAVVAEGLGVLARARHLAMGTLPDEALQPSAEWRNQLEDELLPLATLCRTPLEVVVEPGPGPDALPGEILRSFLRSAARLVIPYARTGLRIAASSGPDHWEVRMSPVTQVPDGLRGVPEGKTGDIAGRWTQRLMEAMGITLVPAEGALAFRIPRR